MGKPTDQHGKGLHQCGDFRYQIDMVRLLFKCGRVCNMCKPPKTLLWSCQKFRHGLRRTPYQKKWIVSCYTKTQPLWFHGAVCPTVKRCPPKLSMLELDPITVSQLLTWLSSRNVQVCHNQMWHGKLRKAWHMENTLSSKKKTKVTPCDVICSTSSFLHPPAKGAPASKGCWRLSWR